jgi:hypothetical protein
MSLPPLERTDLILALVDIGVIAPGLTVAVRSSWGRKFGEMLAELPPVLLDRAPKLVSVVACLLAAFVGLLWRPLLFWALVLAAQLAVAVWLCARRPRASQPRGR